MEYSTVQRKRERQSGRRRHWMRIWRWRGDSEACVRVCLLARMHVFVYMSDKKMVFCALVSFNFGKKTGFNKAYLSWLQQKLTKTQAFKHCFYPKPCRDTMPPHNTWMTTKDGREIGTCTLTLTPTKSNKRVKLLHIFSCLRHIFILLFVFFLLFLTLLSPFLRLTVVEMNTERKQPECWCAKWGTRNVSKWQLHSIVPNTGGKNTPDPFLIWCVRVFRCYICHGMVCSVWNCILQMSRFAISCFSQKQFQLGWKLMPHKIVRTQSQKRNE